MVKKSEKLRKWVLTLEKGRRVSKTVEASLEAHRAGPKQLRTRREVAKREWKGLKWVKMIENVENKRKWVLTLENGRRVCINDWKWVEGVVCG